jgi:hypothetical protein
VNLIDKIPQMTDEALNTLAANARRLAGSGTREQQNDASDVLPAIDAEIKNRREVKLSEMRARASVLQRASRSRKQTRTV